jgi:alpha-glucosidase
MADWWKGGVFYQVYPRSFQDGNGDGVGDLGGIISRLDHIAGLGVDCIWLSPIFPSPQADMGYDVSNYIDVDPLFGSLEDFDLLVREAHARGLKLIIDQVVSHTSDQHPWFKESRLDRANSRADWYVWADAKPDGSPPNNWLSVFGGSAWEWSTARKQYYLHNFLISQPDLNFHNPHVQDAVLETMRFWLERGVDGFRLDTVNYYFHDAELRSNPALRRGRNAAPEINPYDMQSHQFSKSQPENVAWLKRVRALLDQFPGTTSVGEVGDEERSVELMAKYTAGSDMLHMCYSFDLLGKDFEARHFSSKVGGFFAAAGDGWPCWSFSNHDVIRHMTRWAPHGAETRDLAKLAAALLLTLRGTVCLYNGEELGLPETDLTFEELTDPRGIRFWPEDKGRDGCRTPIPWSASAPHAGFTTGTPWLPVKPVQAALSVEAQQADPDSVLAFYRAFIAWRRTQPALVSGDLDFLDLPEPVLGYRRTLDGETLLCLFNLSATPRELVLEGAGALAEISGNATHDGTGLTLGANGFALIAETGAPVPVRVKRQKRA